MRFSWLAQDRPRQEQLEWSNRGMVYITGHSSSRSQDGMCSPSLTFFTPIFPHIFVFLSPVFSHISYCQIFITSQDKILYRNSNRKRYKIAKNGKLMIRSVIWHRLTTSHDKRVSILNWIDFKLFDNSWSGEIITIRYSYAQKVPSSWLLSAFFVQVVQLQPLTALCARSSDRFENWVSYCEKNISLIAVHRVSYWV